MQEIPMTLGLPDTLPPLGYDELRGPRWFGGFGLLLLLTGFFHNALPFRVALACWLVMPLLGFFRRKKEPSRGPLKVQVWIYTCLVVGFGIGFTQWARHLGLAWPIVIGALFLIEGLAGAIASLTEWWRLSLLGHSVGLMICGAGIPFIDNARAGILVGAAVLFGSLLSAAILCWQLRRLAAPPNHHGQ